MGQIVVNVGSFDLTSHNGNTAYSTTRYFTVPANITTTGGNLDIDYAGEDEA